MQPAEPRRPSSGWLRNGFEILLSVGYLFILSAILSGLSETPLWICGILVLCAASGVFIAGLMLAVRWASRDSEARAQWSIGTILFLTFIAAIYFAMVRLMISDSGTRNVEYWFFAFIYGGVLLLMAFPSVLLLGNALLAFAAWMIRRPWVRRRLMRRSPVEPPRVNDSPGES